MEIGEMIKKRREKLGFSQRQLAYLSGVSNTEIKRIEDVNISSQFPQDREEGSNPAQSNHPQK